MRVSKLVYGKGTELRYMQPILFHPTIHTYILASTTLLHIAREQNISRCLQIDKQPTGKSTLEILVEDIPPYPSYTQKEEATYHARMLRSARGCIGICFMTPLFVFVWRSMPWRISDSVDLLSTSRGKIMEHFAWLICIFHLS